MKNKSMYVFLFMMLGLFAGMASPIQTSINSEPEKCYPLTFYRFSDFVFGGNARSSFSYIVH